MSMNLTSVSFLHGHRIPEYYTCDGENVSPRLDWENVPIGTKSLVLIVEDPDAPDPNAPKVPVIHWILYNIPTSVSHLNEGVSLKELPIGTLGGKNDWHRIGYDGLCPEKGEHRYFFKLYALDRVLPDLKAPTLEILEKAMQEHIVGKASLMGLYKRR